MKVKEFLAFMKVRHIFFAALTSDEEKQVYHQALQRIYEDFVTLLDTETLTPSEISLLEGCLDQVWAFGSDCVALAIFQAVAKYKGCHRFFADSFIEYCSVNGHIDSKRMAEGLRTEQRWQEMRSYVLGLTAPPKPVAGATPIAYDMPVIETLVGWH